LAGFDQIVKQDYTGGLVASNTFMCCCCIHHHWRVNFIAIIILIILTKYNSGQTLGIELGCIGTFSISCGFIYFYISLNKKKRKFENFLRIAFMGSTVTAGIGEEKLGEAEMSQWDKLW
jgi:hypothetical protein